MFTNLVGRLSFLSSLCVICLVISGCKGEYPPPTLFELQVQQIEEQDALDPPPENSIVIFGSSSIQLWSSIEEDLQPLPIIARGFYGNTLNHARFYADRMITAYNPDIIVIYDGDNDISLGIPPKQVSEVFIALVDKIRLDLPDTPIYFISIKPSPSRWLAWQPRADTNELIKGICDNDDSLHYIDIVPHMLDDEDNPIEDYYYDGLHLSEKGYELWTSILSPILEDAYFSDPPIPTTP